MSADKVIEAATLELGVTENPPGSNCVKYNDAYYGKTVSGSAYPWCVTFLWWVFQEVQERMAFFGGGRTASCGTLLRWYREQGLTVDVINIRVGDIVILNFSGTKETQHCGLVTEVNRWYETKQLIQIQTIEGNTSPSDGSQSNGGMVCEKTRYPSQIVGVCRPQYKEEEKPVDDITGRWSEADIRWCIKNGLMEGYSDGSWKPKQAVTREELAVVLRRFHRFMEDDGK